MVTKNKKTAEFRSSTKMKIEKKAKEKLEFLQQSFELEK